MTGLERLLDPSSIAIVGLSGDPTKHGSRVLRNLRNLGYRGDVWGVNPRLTAVDGTIVFGSLAALPRPADLVVCAVPAEVTADVIGEAGGSGAAVVFAGGFAESGEWGREVERLLGETASAVGVRLLGPNSGGVIRPDRSLAASFLTCLDRPASEIRTGPVGLVTQSGGMGSYLHNLAAARESGLAISISTGNEVDIKAGEALAAVVSLPEVRSVLMLLETVRDGEALLSGLDLARQMGKAVVACRIGTGSRGKVLMTSHTGAMAVPERVLRGVFDSRGVVVAETPEEGLEVAEILARVETGPIDGVGIVTHSGGMAIHLSDLAERAGLELPSPSERLRKRLRPLLDRGSAENPLDMGGIIGGPQRFPDVVTAFAESREFDAVLAVSTAHPPAHSEQRVEALLGPDFPVPVVHLWMAGDQAVDSLHRLRVGGVPVTDEPRAAIRALRGLADVRPVEERADAILAPFVEWGLPLIQGHLTETSEEAVVAAQSLGYPVVLKIASHHLTHKTDAGAVVLDLRTAEEVRSAALGLLSSAGKTGLEIEGLRVEPYRPGLEVITGGIIDATFGPMVSVGLGGVHTELMGDVVFAPAPLGVTAAAALIGRIRGSAILDGYRGSRAADVSELARLVSVVSRGIAGGGASEVEINPLTWDGDEWVAVDWLVRETSTG